MTDKLLLKLKSKNIRSITPRVEKVIGRASITGCSPAGLGIGTYLYPKDLNQVSAFDLRKNSDNFSSLINSKNVFQRQMIQTSKTSRNSRPSTPNFLSRKLTGISTNLSSSI